MRGPTENFSPRSGPFFVILLIINVELNNAYLLRHTTAADAEKPSQECARKYADKMTNASLADWLLHKNSSHYFSLHANLIETADLEHGLQQQPTSASVSRSCNSRKMRVVMESPLAARALCPFEYVLNYKSNRIPSTLTEVRCSCSRPAQNLIGGKRVFECEPLRYQVRVLLFDSECSTFVEHTETLSLGCISAFQATKTAANDDELFGPISAEAPNFELIK